MSTWVSGWGPMRGFLMLYRSLCGRMRMARASRYVCATILVQTSKVMLLLWLESLVGELGLSPCPLGTISVVVGS